MDVVAGAINGTVLAGIVFLALVALVVVGRARDVAFLVQKLVLSTYRDHRKVGGQLVLAEALAAAISKSTVIRTLLYHVKVKHHLLTTWQSTRRPAPSSVLPLPSEHCGCSEFCCRTPGIAVVAGD